MNALCGGGEDLFQDEDAEALTPISATIINDSSEVPIEWHLLELHETNSTLQLLPLSYSATHLIIPTRPMRRAQAPRMAYVTPFSLPSHIEVLQGPPAYH